MARSKLRKLFPVLLVLVLVGILDIAIVPARLALAATLYESYNSGDDNTTVMDNSATRIAQTFTVGSSHSISSVKLKLSRLNSPGVVNVSIRKTDLVGPGRPTGPDLTSGTINGTGLTTNATGEWYQIVFSNPYTLFSGVKYAIVMSVPGANASNKLWWRRDGTNSTYAGGNLETSTNSGANWTVRGTWDAMFEVWGDLVGEAWVDDYWAGSNPGDSVDGHIFGYDAFATIQDGIDAVTGSTVHVAAGVYTPSETILANKDNLLLEGRQANVDPRPSAGSNRTAGSPSEAVVDGGVGNLGTIIKIQANNVTINGFEVKNGTRDLIFQGDTHTGTAIKYCIIHDGNKDDGAQLKNCTDGLLEYNYVFDIARPGDALSIANSKFHQRQNPLQ